MKKEHGLLKQENETTEEALALCIAELDGGQEVVSYAHLQFRATSLSDHDYP
jgi:hypothetical protein